MRKIADKKCKHCGITSDDPDARFSKNDECRPCYAFVRKPVRGSHAKNENMGGHSGGVVKLA